MSRKEFSIANQVLQENTNIAISALDSVLQEYEQIYKVKQNTETKNNHSSKDATSKLENILINAKKPIYVKETNQLPIIEVNGIKGYWINKDEVANWQGKIPIEKFPINYDKYPKIIKKKNSEKIDHQQWIGVNYLRPPTPPKPGDIIIREEPPKQAPPLSPIIRREVYYVYKNTCKKESKPKKIKEPKKQIKQSSRTTSCVNLVRFQPVSQITLSGSYPVIYPAVQQVNFQQPNYMTQNFLPQQYYRPYYF